MNHTFVDSARPSNDNVTFFGASTEKGIQPVASVALYVHTFGLESYPTKNWLCSRCLNSVIVKRTTFSILKPAADLYSHILHQEINGMLALLFLSSIILVNCKLYMKFSHHIKFTLFLCKSANHHKKILILPDTDSELVAAV